LVVGGKGNDLLSHHQNLCWENVQVGCPRDPLAQMKPFANSISALT